MNNLVQNLAWLVLALGLVALPLPALSIFRSLRPEPPRAPNRPQRLSRHRCSHQAQETRRCLQQQRPYFSESAITDVEAALRRIMSDLEQLCSKDNAPEVVSGLLKQIDVVTGLSSSFDPRRSH